MTQQARSGQFFVQGEKISIKANGIWMADGIEITHEQTCEAFFKAVHWKKPGFNGPDSYYLSIGYETIAIDTEDTPFFVCSVDCNGKKWTAALSDGSTVEIDSTNLSYRGWALYLNICKSHEQKINRDYPWARFLSAPYYELLSHLEEDEKGYYLSLPGKKQAVLMEKDSTATADRIRR